MNLIEKSYKGFNKIVQRYCHFPCSAMVLVSKSVGFQSVSVYESCKCYFKKIKIAQRY